MKKKTDKQIRLLQEKANSGDPASLHELAFYYQAGMYFERDYKKAMQLWKMSAKKGYGPAYYNLVSMYYNGLGVKPNYKEAYKYLNLSIKKKHRFQGQSLIFLAQKFYFDDLLKKRNVKKGLIYFKQAAVKLNNVQAQFNLASMYDSFFDIEPGIKKNDKIAFQYHEMAAKNKFVPSMFRVANEYIKGKIVKKNEALAIKLFKEGSKINNKKILNSIGLDPLARAGVIKLTNLWKSHVKELLKKL
mgnify:FL=1